MGGLARKVGDIRTYSFGGRVDSYVDFNVSCSLREQVEDGPGDQGGHVGVSQVRNYVFRHLLDEKIARWGKK